MTDPNPTVDPGSNPVVHVDPGSAPGRTHPATGPLGRPVESGGSTLWGPASDGQPGVSTGDDGTMGEAGNSSAAPGAIGDGTGSR